MTTQNNNNDQIKLNDEMKSILKIAAWGGLVLLLVALFSYSDDNQNKQQIQNKPIEIKIEYTITESVITPEPVSESK